MRHYEGLIERYWVESKPLSGKELTKLKGHLIECDECLKLMGAYEYASKVLDEIIAEASTGGPGMSEYEQAPGNELDSIVNEFIRGWHAGEQYQKLSWAVVKEKMVNSGYKVENITYPQECYPDMTAFQQETDEVPDIGDRIGIFYGSEINSRIWLDKGYLAFENLPGSVPLIMEIGWEGRTVITLAPQPGETARVPVAEFIGNQVSLTIKVENHFTTRKSA